MWTWTFIGCFNFSMDLMTYRVVKQPQVIGHNRKKLIAISRPVIVNELHAHPYNQKTSAV